MRFLVVDDDYVSRTKLKALLFAYGDGDAVPSGDIALRMFQIGHDEKVPYDLITMDIDMPGLKGQDVVKKIWQWEESREIYMTDQVKILTVTVKNDSENIISSFKEGCDGFLIKPATPEKLRQALAKMSIVLVP